MFACLCATRNFMLVDKCAHKIPKPPDYVHCINVIYYSCGVCCMSLETQHFAKSGIGCETIINSLSVGVRKLQVAILARSSRELYLTVRIV